MALHHLDAQALARITGTKATANLISVHDGLVYGGQDSGLCLVHRLVPYLAQVSHESAGFRYDREIWGPTAAQKRYDTRTDLGNTPERDGDGKKFAGHTAMQITGRYNTGEFRDWCRDRFEDVPDFIETPELMNTDPWEGLGPIWYWDTRQLNRWADKGDFANITRKINGGTNGYADRCERYTQIALRVLGYEPFAVEVFQKDAGLDVDGDAGPKTRAALHEALVQVGYVTFSRDAPKVSTAPSQKSAPVSAPISGGGSNPLAAFGRWLLSLLPKGSL